MAMTKEHRALIFQEGVVFMIAGVLSIIISSIYGVMHAPVLAWLLIAVGAYKTTQLLFHDRGSKGYWVPVAIAVSYVGIGAWLVSQPEMSTMLMAIAFSVLWGVTAILFSIQAWHWKSSCHCWAYLALAGLLSAALAALIWSAWSEDQVWVVGLLMGLQLILYGLALAIITAPFWHSRR